MYMYAPYMPELEKEREKKREDVEILLSLHWEEGRKEARKEGRKERKNENKNSPVFQTGFCLHIYINHYDHTKIVTAQLLNSIDIKMLSKTSPYLTADVQDIYIRRLKLICH